VLEELKTKFLAMYGDPDPQGRGRRFEELLNQLFCLFDLNPRKSFAIADEQIDGAFTFNTDDFLLEAKWGSPDVSVGRVRGRSVRLIAVRWTSRPDHHILLGGGSRMQLPARSACFRAGCAAAQP
jgi:hypothetical protein